MAIDFLEIIMRIVNSSSGKKQVKISRKEWEDIGKTAGWMRQAQEGDLFGLKSTVEKIIEINTQEFQYKSKIPLQLINLRDNMADSEEAVLVTNRVIEEISGSGDVVGVIANLLNDYYGIDIDSW